MEQLHQPQSVQPNQQGKNSAKSVEKLTAFVTQLNQLGEQSQSLFGTHLLTQIRGLISQISDSINQPTKSPAQLAQSTVEMLSMVGDLDPEFLENGCDELKAFRKKSKQKVSLVEFVQIQSLLVGQFHKVKGASATATMDAITRLDDYVGARDVDTTSNKTDKDVAVMVVRKEENQGFQGFTKQALALIQSAANKARSSVISEATGMGGHMVSLVADLDPEQIKEMVQAILNRGIQSIEDLMTLLQLIGELGLSVDVGMLNDLTDSLQEFLESQACQISDPSQFLAMLAVIQQFGQSDLMQRLDLDPIENKLTELLETDPMAASHQVSAESFGIQIQSMAGTEAAPLEGVSEASSLAEAGTVNAVPGTSATAFAASQSRSFQSTSGTHGQEASVHEVSGVESISEPVDFEEKKELVGKLLTQLDTATQHAETQFLDAMLEMMSELMKSRLDQSIDMVLGE